jgi:hypothetical protein
MKKTVLVVFACIAIMLSTVSYAAPVSNSNVLASDKAKIINKIYEGLEKQLTKDYSEIYSLKDFSYDYSVREKSGIAYIDLDIHTVMTLTRSSSESPFIQGIQEANVYAKSKLQRDAIQKEIEFYSDCIDMYFLVPENATFTYSIILEKENPKIYYRHDTSDGVVLINTNDLAEVEDADISRKKGLIAGLDAAINTNNARQSVVKNRWTYNRLDARDWANNNATSASEFPSKDVPGSDCANFVSKAINAGGIPQDTTGKWYKASPPGSWPGDNWFRTGYNGNGGVVPYMTGKGYFYLESSYTKVIAGSILYWTTTSHVALITYGDTVTIKYAQHGSNNNKDNVYRDANGTYVSNVSFYVPSASIM